jgi:hypothetical protein
MVEMYEIQDPGDVVYTLPEVGEHRGRLRAWQVQDDGTLTEMQPEERAR